MEQAHASFKILFLLQISDLGADQFINKMFYFYLCLKNIANLKSEYKSFKFV